MGKVGLLCQHSPLFSAHALHLASVVHPNSFAQGERSMIQITINIIYVSSYIKDLVQFFT